MANAGNTLKLIEKGCWENYVQYQQLDDGTLVYLEMSVPQKFYVKFNGKRINAVLPEGKFKMMDAHSNSVYLMRAKELLTQPGVKHYADGFLDYSDQIYEAVFTPPASLTVSLLKNRRQPYEIFGTSNSVMCTTIRNGKTYAHKIWQVSESDDILNNVQESFQLMSIHRRVKCQLTSYLSISIPRKQLYFFNMQEFLTKQSLDKIRENCYAINILAKMPWISIHTRDSTAFYYLTDGMCLFTLNTDTKKFLPPLQFSRHEYEGIELIGVFNGLLTMRGTHNGLNYLFAARLPAGYFDTINTTCNADSQRKTEQVKEDVVAQQHINMNEESVNKKMDVMRSIISELQEKNSKLSDELERLQIVNKEMEIATIEVSEENKKLKNELESIRADELSSFQWRR